MSTPAGRHEFDRTPFAVLDYLVHKGGFKRRHSGHHLLQHLHGTRQLLLGWGARRALAMAGLLHSVYGTESFSDGLVGLEERETIQTLVGREAEGIAYSFSSMRRDSFFRNLEHDQQGWTLFDRFMGTTLPIDRSEFVDLCNLHAANCLEQLPRLPAEFRHSGGHDLEAILSFLLPPARAAVLSALPTRTSHPI